MSFDCSRYTFDPTNDFLGVIMQQGRVQLDADWNELVAQLTRRLQAGTLDTFSRGTQDTRGRAVVPRETPDGFRIEAAGGSFTIGRGRIYVDGLLAENHGAIAPGASEWDPALAELRGSASVPYKGQPYDRDPVKLPGGGPHLVYLDVWQRDITFLEHPELVEKAVGVDTTARLQTVWQVKVLPKVGDIDCNTPDDEIPNWTTVTQPSAGRLTTSTGDVSGEPDPCHVPASGGYKGLENQLYRIEIHEVVNGKASFKWSRDNATVATRVTNINSDRNKLEVERVGRDDAGLRFSDGDWVEVTDERRELNGEPGLLRRIKLGGGVDDATRTIMLELALPANVFPTDAKGKTDPSRLTRIRRWDQQGQVKRADGTVFHDLDAATSNGAIPVPDDGTELLLEHGILVHFDLDDVDGTFRIGDHWVFAARAADASIELLEQAPPRGTHHHYCRLAIVTFPDDETDCRVLWPPEADEDEGCACTVCVTAEGHRNGFTIQMAIDKVKETGGTVCLGPGVFPIKRPLRIVDAESLRLRGHGFRTVVQREAPGGVIEVRTSSDVVLEDFAVVGAGVDDEPAGLIRIENVNGCDLKQLTVAGAPKSNALALELRGYVFGADVRDCLLIADIGVASGINTYLLSAGLELSNNSFWCTRRGVSLEWSVHYGATTIADNMFTECANAGLVALGGGFPGSPLAVSRNVFHVRGSHIVVGTDGARIERNDLHPLPDGKGGDGIVLAPGLDPGGVDHCRIIGNRIVGLGGNGIVVRTVVNSLMIKQNVIDGLTGAAYVVQDGSVGNLAFENNQILNMSTRSNPRAGMLAAVRVMATERAVIAGNVIDGFARDALQSAGRAAIQVIATEHVHIAANQIHAIGPVEDFTGYSAAIELIQPFDRAAMVGNALVRAGPDEQTDFSIWLGIRVPSTRQEALHRIADETVYALANGNLVLFTASRVRLRRVERDKRSGSGTVSVRGNSVECARTGAPLVEVDAVETCLFTENHCLSTEGGGKAGLVVLSNSNVIASNNRLRGRKDVLPALHIRNSNAWTAVGNLVSGPILVNNAILSGEFQPLNVFAP